MKINQKIQKLCNKLNFLTYAVKAYLGDPTSS